MALVLEAVVALASPFEQLGRGARHRVHEELLAIMVDQGSLAALPLYTASYVLMAASHYVSGVPVRLESQNEEARLPAAIPVLATVFAEYNLVNLAVLVAATILALREYGAARPVTIVFYSMLALSHALPSLIILGYAAWWSVPASTMLRGLAPLTLALASRLTGRV